MRYNSAVIDLQEPTVPRVLDLQRRIIQKFAMQFQLLRFQPREVKLFSFHNDFPRGSFDKVQLDFFFQVL